MYRTANGHHLELIASIYIKFSFSLTVVSNSNNVKELNILLNRSIVNKIM